MRMLAKPRPYSTDACFLQHFTSILQSLFVNTYSDSLHYIRRELMADTFVVLPPCSIILLYCYLSQSFPLFLPLLCRIQPHLFTSSILFSLCSFSFTPKVSVVFASYLFQISILMISSSYHLNSSPYCLIGLQYLQMRLYNSS